MEAEEKKTAYVQLESNQLSPDLAAARLDEALESEDIRMFMTQLGQVIKARGGYASAARAAGLNRTALYKIVSKDGNPALNTLVSLLTPLGLRLSIKPIGERDAHGNSDVEFSASGTHEVFVDRLSLREE